jgi:alpha-glucosidase (family GH31 glycosyl hydrolase)
VEPICRTYLELRYRMLPYLYTAVRDATETGMPVMRALWLHHADDPKAVADGSAFLFGRDMLVAPVVAKGATSRRLYLPRGRWWDFWTEQSTTGAREVERAVDLATLPLYVRAGAVLPLDPVRQYTEEPVDAPTTLVVYPGADGVSSLYDDDGHTLDYVRGDAMRLTMTWRDADRRLTLRLAPGTRLRGAERRFLVRVAGSSATTPVTFRGKSLDVHLPNAS